MKTLKRSFYLVALLVFLSSLAYSQQKYSTSKSKQWSLTPEGGVSFPVGSLSENYKAGGNFGLDLNYQANKEVGFYGKVGYYIMSSKTPGVTDGKYLEYTAGPRYTFRNKKLKSSIFLEAGLGAYTFQQNSYSYNGVDFPENSTTDFGVNAGLGAVLNLGRDVDLLFKAKYHSIFINDGSSSFITPVLGIDVRL